MAERGKKDPDPVSGVFPTTIWSQVRPLTGSARAAALETLAHRYQGPAEAFLGTALGLSTLTLLSVSGRGPLVFGLPPAAWVFVVGFGLLPLVLVVVGHAVTFDARPRARDGRPGPPERPR